MEMEKEKRIVTELMLKHTGLCFEVTLSRENILLLTEKCERLDDPWVKLPVLSADGIAVTDHIFALDEIGLLGAEYDPSERDREAHIDGLLAGAIALPGETH